MAKQIVVLALILFAVVGMASAASTPSAAPTTSSSGTVPLEDPSEGPAYDEGVIGAIGGSSDAAPLGGPVPDGAFTDVVTPAASPENAAEATTVAAGAMAAAAVAGALFF